jgi:DNA-binding NtrC family response regulator
VAATNQDLEASIRAGRFREDLFYRLNVIPIHVPPLRERREDVPLLVQHFLANVARERERKVDGISPEALECLCAHSWPGNVRELENLIERLVVMRGEGRLELEDLPQSVRGAAGAPLSPAAPTLPPSGLSFHDAVNRLETDLIVQALERTRGNKNQAARLLGLNRTTLLEKIKKKGLDVSRA